MKIVYFHNWSLLGAAVGHALLREGKDELLLLGAPVNEDAIDRQLVRSASAQGMACAMGDVTSEGVLDEVRRFGADVLFTATFPTRLPPHLLALGGRGAFNLHPSLLPAYRGASPEFWTVRNGDARSGLTIHRMVDRFDAGAIVSQLPVDIASDETLRSLSTKLAMAAPALALDFLERLGGGEVMGGWEQDDRLATRARLPTPADLTIRWADGAKSIERLIRACDDHFDATSCFRDARLIVRSAHVAEDGPILAAGELRSDRTTGLLWVGTGDAALAIDSVEFDGVRSTGAAFAAEHRVSDGEVLSPRPSGLTR